jgi:arsenate reductase (thioredoxin)
MNPNKSRFTIMFLCTGNSARSIFAEYLLRKIAPARFETYSAGAHPKPSPHPLARKVLREDFKIDASDAYSKSWDEFKDVPFDFVITLCDNAKETCPVWPGQPILAHWSSPDPAAVEGSEANKLRAFWQVAQQIKRRLELLASLPFEKLDVLRLEAATKEIGIREKIRLSDQTPA